MTNQNDLIIFALEAVSNSLPGDILKFSELADQSEFEESQIEEAYRHLIADNLISGTKIQRPYAINDPNITDSGIKKLQDFKDLKCVFG